MPKVNNTRKQRAIELRERVKRGPEFSAEPFSSLTEEQRNEVRGMYILWSQSWILPDLNDLVPELRS